MVLSNDSHKTTMFHEPEDKGNIITIAAHQTKTPEALMKQVHSINGQSDISGILFREMLMNCSHAQLCHRFSPGMHLRGRPISVNAPKRDLSPLGCTNQDRCGSTGRAVFSIDEESYLGKIRQSVPLIFLHGSTCAFVFQRS
jgi:hypothetical protein